MPSILLLLIAFVSQAPFHGKLYKAQRCENVVYKVSSNEKVSAAHVIGLFTLLVS